MRNKRGILTAVALILFAAAIFASLATSHREKLITKRNTATPVPEEAAQTVTITATGDCTLATDVTTPVEGSFESKMTEINYDYSYFLKNFSQLFSEDDLTIVNFEGTLSTNGTRSDKSFAFRGNPDYVNILTSASVEAANLANNHSHDYGTVSFTDTMDVLKHAGIITFAGTATEIVEINGIKVGLVGINALNDEGTAQVAQCVGQVKTGGAQIVILSVHWGIETAEEPTTDQVRLAHQAIDAGADLVIGTHPHVIQGVEKYKGRYIAYSLGNFCFGGNTNPDDKDTMLLRATFTLNENGTVADDDNVYFIPAKISSSDDCNDYCPIIADGDERTRIINKINERTDLIAPLTLNFR